MLARTVKLSRRSVQLGTAKVLSAPHIATPLALNFSTGAVSKSWVPTENDLLQKVTTQALVHEVSLQQMESAAAVVPWFLKNMPASYFKQVPESLRRQHLKAIAAIRDLKQSDLSLKIDTKHENGSSEVTFINTHTSVGLLQSQIKNLIVPKDSHLSRVKVFSSLDNELAINIFSFEPTNVTAKAASHDDAKAIFNYIAELKHGQHATNPSAPKYSAIFDEAAMADYLPRVSPAYAQSSDPRRFLIQKEMFEKLRATDGVAVHIEHSNQLAGGSWITIAAANVLPEVMLRLSSSMLFASKLEISRAHLDTVSDHENSSPELPAFVTMLRLLVSDPSKPSVALQHDSPFMTTVLKDLKRAKWLDDETTELGLVRFPNMGIDKAEVITALCSMLHGPLAKQNSQAYASVKSIVQIISASQHFLQQADAIAQLFLDRFRPHGAGISNAEFTAREQDLHSKISRLQMDAARVVLLKMLEATKATLRTNFYNENRYALSLRVHPSIMATGDIGKVENKPLPFGVFFSHGRLFNGFHCRFRDIARGGLRLVTPPNSDQHALESTRQFDEAYGLSYAQQLKNKDIPEGGAKAVVLVNTPAIGQPARFFSVRKSLKAFTDSLLDLMVKDSVKDLVDFYGKDELVYLGPDEQVIPSDIDWIIQRAAQRGYPIPAAFMSSKQGAGINHKQYGVTSEGVVVFLDVALRSVLNINPRTDPFTIKITGGPDGDVAGNLMKILFREYGSNCKVLGVADGFGVAEDPEGLNSTELLRLFNEALPITKFDTSKLSKNGLCLDASTDEGLARRNSMHFRIKADAFVPAGGRPNTMNIDNWRQFLDADGKPSSRLIVEGANIFTTPEAREALFKHAGVTIVKDSSANKCGVITSSCEVAASMLLSKEEFLGIKDELVNDVVVRLKEVAKLEADLLFREYNNYPGNLPHFSERISGAINKVTDAITDALANVNPGDALFEELLPIVKENLPKKLADVAWDRASARFPVQYQRNAIASSLASAIVYKEGIHLIETQPQEKIADRAFMYYREDMRIRKLIKELEGKDLGADKAKVLDLLKRGGARTSLDIF